MKEGEELELIKTFRGRLEELFRLCDDVAREEGAHLNLDTVVQNPFSAQMSSGWRKEKLPTATLDRAGVEIKITPSEISSNFTSEYYGRVSVDRKLLGAGRLDSPSCWTALNNSDDPLWYDGAVGNRKTPVDKRLIKSWLYHSGPRPIC